MMRGVHDFNCLLASHFLNTYILIYEIKLIRNVRAAEDEMMALILSLNLHSNLML